MFPPTAADQEIYECGMRALRFKFSTQFNGRYTSHYLSIYLSICLSVCLSVCPSVRPVAHTLEHRASVKPFVSLHFLNLSK
jgi:hypothetical protein